MQQQHTLESLRNQLQHWESKHHSSTASEIISSGCETFDQWLPKGGFVRGQLVEWLGEQPGSGASTLAWMIALRSTGALNSEEETDAVDFSVRKTIVVIDRTGDFYAPAAIAWGIEPEQLMMVRPKNHTDTMWAIDQALRCSAVAAVWAELDKIEPTHFRRMQLAAEEGATLGLLVRPGTAQGQPSWSDLQLLVKPLPTQQLDKHLSTGHLSTGHLSTGHLAQNRQAHCASGNGRQWQLKLLRCRGGTAGGTITLQMDETTGQLHTLNTNINHETSALHLAAQLARPANHRRSARA